MVARIGSIVTTLTGDARPLAKAYDNAGESAKKWQRSNSAAFAAMRADSTRATNIVSADAARFGKVMQLNRMTMLELGHTARASFDIIAAGGSPLRALELEGLQAVQALSLGKGGLGGAIQGIGASLARLATPTNFAIAAVSALAAGAILWLTSERSKTVDATAALKEHKAWLDKILAGYKSTKKAADDYLASVAKLPEGAIASNLTAHLGPAMNQVKTAIAELNQYSAHINLDLTDPSQMGGQYQTDQVKKVIDAVQAAGLSADSTDAKFKDLVSTLTVMSNTGADAERVIAQRMLGFVTNAEKAKAIVDSLHVSLDALPSSVTTTISVQMNNYKDALAKLQSLTPDLRDTWTRQRDDATSAYNTARGAAPDDIERVAATSQYQKTMAGIAAAQAADAAKKSAPALNKQASATKRVVASLNAQIDALSQTAEQQQIANNLARAGVTADSKQGQTITALTQKLYNQKAAQDTINQATSFFATTAESAFAGLITGSDSFTDSLKNMLSALENAVLQATLLGQGPLAGLFGTKSATGGVGGALGSLIGAVAKSFDTGGYTGSGTANQAAGIVHRGEVVWSQSDVRRWGGPTVVDNMRRGFSGYADGGVVGMKMPTNFNGGGANVQIINNGPPVEVQSQKKVNQGGVSIDQIVIGAVKKGIANGTLDGINEQVYGLKRRGRN